MKAMVFGMLAVGLLSAAAGCARNAIVGDAAVRTDQFFGEVGITGSGGNVTILRGSKVPKLSVLGHENRITIEEGVWVGKIEFWGNNNTVSVPEDMTVHTTQVGTNQIVRRARERSPLPPAPTYEPLPSDYESPSFRPPPTHEPYRPREAGDTAPAESAADDLNL